MKPLWIWGPLSLMVGAMLWLGPATVSDEQRAKPSQASTRGSAAPVAAKTPDPARGVGLPYYGDASFTPHWVSSPTKLAKGFHRAPTFAVHNQAGEPISERDVEGKVYIANFFFTTCAGICAAMTRNLARVQQALRDERDLRILSHSVTPDVDTIDVLSRYAERHGCQPGTWHLVRAPEAQILDLGRNGYFIEEDRGLERDAFLHSENLVLVDRQRYIRGIYNGLRKGDVDQLVEDARWLLAQ